MELFLEGGKLVSFEDWKEKLGKIKPERLVNDESKCVNSIAACLQKSVKSRARDGMAIFFSGGVDSTLLAFLCTKENINFTCCSVGIKGSADLEWARKISENYSFNLVEKEFTIEEVEIIIKKTAKLLLPKVKENPAVTIGVGSVVAAARSLSSAKYFFSGLGSEEIFAGYERHASKKSSEINEECWNGLVNMWHRDLIRDCALASELKIEVATPYLDEELIRAAMKVPGKYKIVGGVKKMVLRKAALRLGLDEEFAMRPKKAAQYGSGFDKAIEKLAKKNGFSNKKDYLESLVS